MSKPQSTEPIATSLAGVARVFGIHPDTAKTWRAQGMPGEPGSYPLAAIYRWLHGPDGPRGKKIAPQLITEAIDNLRDAEDAFERDWCNPSALELDAISLAQLRRMSLLAGALLAYLESIHDKSRLGSSLRFSVGYLRSAIDDFRVAAGDLPPLEPVGTQPEDSTDA